MTNQETDNASDDSDIFQLLGIMWRGKFVILSCALIVGSMGGYYAYKVAEPSYSATARLALQVRDQKLVDLDSVISGVSRDRAALNTEVEVIRSRTLIERLVVDMNLTKDPEFNARLREEPKISVSKVRETLRNLVTGGAAAAPEPPPSDEAILLSTVNAARGAISVSTLRDTYLFDISATTGHPGKSAKMANRLAQLYLDDQVQTKFEATDYAINWLSDRVNELEVELKQKGESLSALRGKTNLVSLEALEGLNIRAKDIRDRLLATQSRTAAAKETLLQNQNVLGTGDPEVISAQFDDQVLRRLANAISSGDEDAKPLFDTRVETALAAQTAEVDRLKSQRDVLQDSLADIQKKIDAQNEDLTRITQLERELAATRTLYETFLNRLKETSIQVGLQRPDARILSEAGGGRLVAPRKSRILIFNLFLGALIGTAVVMGRQFLHKGFRTAGELQRMAGIPVIGQIPKISIKKREGLIEFLRNNPTSGGAEAIRNLRTSVLMSSIDKRPQVIMSTSALPSEGKTTQAVALTMNLAAMGSRVLLVECDVRRRTLGHYFDDMPPGTLLDVISGEKKIEQSVMQVESLGADVLLSSRLDINGADLFASDHFTKFIRELRKAYDYIILDTPPVQVVPDARIISVQTDAVIYNVAWNDTPRDVALEGLQQFKSVGVSVTGVVLSKVDERRLKQYGYGYMYGGKYGRGYYGT
ncbi:GumC family protein [Mameliella alba]|uniref:non-specific protein-tyrosine kinase n=1 Tax=Mameliella alba TaxID=561184 RepID=A0A0B3SHV3_9RHOB|nr:polysaccharide biosynthesis tyrosine autokinase [Mameliella alba]KHQ50154.1 Succinoglycan biosynthesis transport protein exoP [Mameliella alba]